MGFSASSRLQTTALRRPTATRGKTVWWTPGDPSLNAEVIFPLTVVAELLRLGCWVERRVNPVFVASSVHNTETVVFFFGDPFDDWVVCAYQLLSGRHATEIVGFARKATLGLCRHAPRQ